MVRFVAIFCLSGIAPLALSDAAAAGDEPEPQAHWSFRPIRRPVVPQPCEGAWVRNPIDAFILRKLDETGLKPAGEATRLALLRRASFDLLGLPPTAEEIERFVHDARPDAYERLIDRLLGSPQYGERWGRHWLDVVRYADTGGFELDLLYRDAWRYRDYVIRSLAADKPLDRFIAEQIAGDELWPDDPEAALGSALYCVGPTQPESAMVSGQLDYQWLSDAADTTGEVFLGLSMGCARCHDHKYDPIRQRDYFALQAFFAASDRPYPLKVRVAGIKAINGLLSDAAVPEKLMSDPRCTIKLDSNARFQLFHRAEPLVVHRLHRGELSKPEESVGPAFPAIFAGRAGARDLSGVVPRQRRAELARWLISPGNPLVARVLANRVWGWHFGQALLRTPSDFGAHSDEPAHPELLDFLARELLDHGWGLKRLHRTIMLSSAYRMSSAAAGPGITKDPENALLWHFPRRRLEGEEIRDAMLACAGTLSIKPFGKPVVPPLDREELTGLFDAKEKWTVTKNRAEHVRRSVYLLVRRTFTLPIFSAFDPPEVMTSCPRRMQTIVPTQALTLLNSPFAREQAAAFARRIEFESGHDLREAVSHAFRHAYGRPITSDESRHAATFLEQRMPAAGRGPALAELCLALFNANEFVFID
jgi:hypothetical protein